MATSRVIAAVLTRTVTLALAGCTKDSSPPPGPAPSSGLARPSLFCHGGASYADAAAALASAAVDQITDNPARPDVPLSGCELAAGSTQLQLGTQTFGEQPPQFLATYGYQARPTSVPLPLASAPAGVLGQVDDTVAFLIRPCGDADDFAITSAQVQGSGAGATGDLAPRRAALAKLVVTMSNSVARVYRCPSTVPAAGQPKPAPAAVPLAQAPKPCGLASAAPVLGALRLPAPGGATVRDSGTSGPLRSCEFRSGSAELLFDTSTGLLATYAAPYPASGTKVAITSPAPGAAYPGGAWLDCPGKRKAYRLASPPGTALPVDQVRDLFLALVTVAGGCR